MEERRAQCNHGFLAVFTQRLLEIREFSNLSLCLFLPVGSQPERNQALAYLAVWCWEQNADEENTYLEFNTFLNKPWDKKFMRENSKWKQSIKFMRLIFFLRMQIYYIKDQLNSAEKKGK